MAVEIIKKVVGAVQTNCYVIFNQETKEAIVVDPGDNAEVLIETLEHYQASLEAILLTHGHFDHVMAVESLLAYKNVPVVIHEQEKELLNSSQLNVSFMIGQSLSFRASEYVKDQDVLEYAHIPIKVIYTPGHTGGGVCYYLSEEKALISGDTLFKESIGRTDLPTGSMTTLISSIKDSVLTLADDVVVYPGHGDKTSIANEKKYNPFL